MISLQQIVVATDLSDNSLQAVSYACSLAEQFGSDVHLLHIVVHPFVEFAEASQRDFARKFSEIEQQQLEAAKESLEGMTTEPLSDPVRLSRITRSGFPVTDIPRYVDETNSDLLVLGTHGRTGLKHVLMGSVCEAIVRHARCPVLTVRSSES